MVPCAPSNITVLPARDGLVQEQRGVAHHGPDALRKGFVLVADGRQIQLFIDAQRFGDDSLFLHHRIELRPENIGIQQIGDADAAAGNLVFVARPDAARSGADGDPARPAFAHPLHHAVRREQHVRPVADGQNAGDFHSGRFQRFDLGEQRRRIDHQAVADHRLFARAQNAARNQLQYKFLFADKNRVAGVMSALIARDDIEPVREEVDDLPLTLVSPLGA